MKNIIPTVFRTPAKEFNRESYTGFAAHALKAKPEEFKHISDEQLQDICSEIDTAHYYQRVMFSFISAATLATVAIGFINTETLQFIVKPLMVFGASAAGVFIERSRRAHDAIETSFTGIRNGLPMSGLMNLMQKGPDAVQEAFDAGDFPGATFTHGKEGYNFEINTKTFTPSGR